jgi:hypothetical protein
MYREGSPAAQCRINAFYVELRAGRPGRAGYSPCKGAVIEEYPLVDVARGEFKARFPGGRIGSLIPEIILPVVGPGAYHGITWHYTYPPVVGLELEIDVRGVLREFVC